MALIDCHNHLQDERLRVRADALLAEVRAAGCAWMVVNGTRPSDWEAVSQLVARHPEVIPSYGVHPWHVGGLDGKWSAALAGRLESGGAAVGEVGLDRWIEGHDSALQETVFKAQLEMAAERSLPVTIHCLKAWGPLVAMLAEAARPSRGIVLHSFGGTVEVMERLAAMGGYFSFSGYAAHARKARQREVMARVPRDRLLLETDAPDMTPPEEWNRHPLPNDAQGRPVNHPANIGAVYEWAAAALGCTSAALESDVAENFERVFGGVRAGSLAARADTT